MICRTLAPSREVIESAMIQSAATKAGGSFAALQHSWRRLLALGARGGRPTVNCRIKEGYG